MKKTFFVIAVGALVLIGFFVFRPAGPVGVSFSEPNFTTSTNTQIACSFANVSTAVVDGGAKSGFIASNLGVNTIYLCRNANVCSATSGIPIYATSTPFVQTDGYVGAYTCRATVATTSLNVLYAF